MIYFTMKISPVNHRLQQIRPASQWELPAAVCELGPAVEPLPGWLDVPQRDVLGITIV
jgi:hypothetical protein